MSAQKPVEVITIPELDELLSTTETARLYPYEKTIDHAWKEPFVALHTSGSTGPPKLTVLTHGTFAACDGFQSITSLGHPPTAIEALKGKRVFLGMPPSHAAGLFALLAMPVFYNVIPVMGPPISLTTDIIDEIHAHGNVKASIVRASVLEEIINRPSYLERLTGLDFVLNGGCALSQTAGDQIIKKTSILSFMSSTETLLLPMEFPDREDWQYCSFSPCMGAEFRHYCNDLYEMVIVRNADYEKYQAIFATFPHLLEYSMKDVYSKHPSKPGLWRYEGRCDNIITFSHGRKLNVLPMEKIITSHTAVSAAMVVGQARMQSALLIEASQPFCSNKDIARLVDSVWPYVERANQTCDEHGRISRDRIIFSSPEKPMVRSKNGNIDRRGTLTRYEKEIDVMYTIANPDAANITRTKSPAAQRNPSTVVSGLRFHSATVLSHWEQLLGMIGEGGYTYTIDGNSLDMATIVAVAR